MRIACLCRVVYADAGPQLYGVATHSVHLQGQSAAEHGHARGDECERGHAYSRRVGLGKTAAFLSLGSALLY